jgi:hypothetical protein
MIKNNISNKRHVILDLGPSTVIVISEILLIILKLLGYIQYSWELILSPILLVIFGAAVILLVSLVKMIKTHIF